MRVGHSTAAYRWLIVLLSVVLLLSCLIALAFGPASVPLAKVAGIVGQQLGMHLKEVRDPVGHGGRGCAVRDERTG